MANHNFIDMTGRVFGSLLVVREAGRTKEKHAVWLVRCEHGTEFTALGKQLRNGATTGCARSCPICPNGHDTGSVGRDKGGHCRQCLADLRARDRDKLNAYSRAYYRRNREAFQKYERERWAEGRTWSQRPENAIRAYANARKYTLRQQRQRVIEQLEELNAATA